MQKILRIDPKDNLIVALRDLAQGDIIENEGQRIQLVTDVPAKHKFTREPVPVGGIVTLYGVPVGKAVAPAPVRRAHHRGQRGPLRGGSRPERRRSVHVEGPGRLPLGEPHVRRRDPPRRARGDRELLAHHPAGVL